MERMTAEQLRELIENINGVITDLKNKIVEHHAEMSKAIEKRDFKEVDWCNSRITRDFEQIKVWESRLKEHNFDLEKAEAVESAGKGFEVVIEYLEDLFEKDMVWFDELKTKPREEIRNETKVVKAIYSMTRSQAKATFKQDILYRYYKLVNSVKKKVGENIIECELRRNEKDGLDGWIKGDKGQATLTTIGAGGYNIQRFHFRTLVK